MAAWITIFAYVQQEIALQMKKPVTAAEPHSPQIKVVGRMGETEFAIERDASRSTMRTPQVQYEPLILTLCMT